jgi:hypothetical protein
MCSINDTIITHEDWPELFYNVAANLIDKPKYVLETLKGYRPLGGDRGGRNCE